MGLSPTQRRSLVLGLVSAFRSTEREFVSIVSYYDADKLPEKISGDLAIEDLAQRVVDVASNLGEPVLESVLRSARRARPANTELVSALAAVWPFAPGIDFEYVDEIRA